MLYKNEAVGLIPEAAKCYDAACKEIVELEKLTGDQWGLVSKSWLSGYVSPYFLSGMLIGAELALWAVIVYRVYKENKKEENSKK